MADKTVAEIEADNRAMFAQAAKDAAESEPVTTPNASEDADPVDTTPDSNGDAAPENKDKSGADTQPDPTKAQDQDGDDKAPAAKKPEAKVEKQDDDPDGVADKDADDLPVAMQKRFSEKWKAADAEFKAEVKRVLENDQQTITRLKSKNKTLEDAISVANPEIMQDVRNFKITQAESIRNRLALVSAFQRNPDETIIGVLKENSITLNNPAGLIRAIARHSKLDLETLAKVNPETAVLEDRNAAYEARDRANKERQRAAAEASNDAATEALVEEARAFLARHPEIDNNETFKRQMDAVAIRILQENPEISSADLFEQSYAVIRGLANPAPQATAPAATKPVVKVIPKKPTPSLTPSADAGERATAVNINVNDPNERRKLFHKIAKQTGLS